MPMADSKKFPFLILFLLFMLHLHESTAQIKGGYWFPASGFPASNINSKLFTHLFCASTDVDPNTYKVTISSSNSPHFSSFTQIVQQKNPSVKTLLSIGGGNANPSIFSAMASQNSSRKSFINSSIQLDRSNNFHGIDLHWEYPSSTTNMQNFGVLAREFRASLISEGKTFEIPPLIFLGNVIYSIDLQPLNYAEIEEISDFVNVMAYDFHGPNWFPNRTAPPAALYSQQNSGVYQVSGDQGIRSWIGAGVAARKLILGVPYYGYAWRLVNGNNNGLYAPANGSAFGGDGSMGYNQIRAFVSQNRAVCVCTIQPWSQITAMLGQHGLATMMFRV